MTKENELGILLDKIEIRHQQIDYNKKFPLLPLIFLGYVVSMALVSCIFMWYESITVYSRMWITTIILLIYCIMGCMTILTDEKAKNKSKQNEQCDANKTIKSILLNGHTHVHLESISKDMQIGLKAELMASALKELDISLSDIQKVYDEKEIIDEEKDDNNKPSKI